MNDTDFDSKHEIRLSKGRCFACVSAIDAEYVQQFTWSAVSTRYRTYAVRSERGNNRKKIQLAREVMVRMIGRELIPGETVRHKNKNSLDNTRDNLILKGSQ